MNKHITEYLDYYIRLENPQYAILLMGNWGCGKTYFIKQLITQWSKKDDSSAEQICLKPIYVSLNGISNVDVINDRIRAIISPFLYSKGMKVAKKIFAGLLKTTIKINVDLDRDGKDDDSISYNIDSLGIFDISNNKDVKGDRILIFDDIERCKVKTDEIFGYINHFVEHSNCKVILLADEQKIKAKYDKNKDETVDVDYKDFKEKLIGQTFEVYSDINTAVTYFIQESEKINSNIELNKFQDLVKELFISSDLKNLRVLKQSLLDFNRLVTLIDSEFRVHEKFDEFIKNLLAYFIIVYAEYKTGNDKINEYQGFNYFNNNNDNSSKIVENKYSSILEKYGCYHSTYVFPITSIIRYVETGSISENDMNGIIRTNIFFRKEQEQDWEKLWRWYVLEDATFNVLRDKVWKQFSDGKISETTVLLHIAGIFIRLIDEGFVKKNKNYIVKKSKQILTKIFANNPNYNKSHTAYGIMNASWGKEYQSFKSQEFIEIKAFLEKKVEDSQSAESKNYVKNLFEEITEESINLLYENLKKTVPDGSIWYERTAIFKTVNGRKLGRKIKTFKNCSIVDFRSFIHSRYYPEERYSNVTLEEYHKEDVPCLIDLKAELEKNLSSKISIKNRLLIELINEISTIIEKINKI